MLAQNTEHRLYAFVDEQNYQSGMRPKYLSVYNGMVYEW